MKIRNGFVSNSSSSSYVIACDPEVNLYDLFPEKYHSGDATSIDAVGIEDLFEELKCWYDIDHDYGGWEDAEAESKYRKDQFTRFSGLMSKVARAVDDGDEVALVCISYGDDDSYDNLHSAGIRVIESFT